MRTFHLALVAVLCLGVTTTQAALTIPGADGSDGVLNITEDTVIDLSEAVAATWDTDNGANAGKGVYDAAQWAVVFKYASVTVAAGATLSYVNHPSRAPVVWLVSGDVSVEGSVSVNGSNGLVAPALADPGPGGFRGGAGEFTPGAVESAGFGPGGGGFSGAACCAGGKGYGGSYGTPGGSGAPTYGNPSLVPLLGGSGGGGDPDNNSGGGSGGGALLIASSGMLTVNGSIVATGGSASQNHAGGGSGGGLRLVTDSLAGSGVVRALGGSGGNAGGLGRIRIEYVNDTGSLQVTPDPSVVQLAADSVALLWPPADAPRVTIVSIGGENVPDDPAASFGTQGADAVLPETASTQVVVETTNVEQASQVQVRVTPRNNASFSVVDAVVDSVVSTSPLTLLWTADIPVQIGYAAVQVKVIRP